MRITELRLENIRQFKEISFTFPPHAGAGNFTVFVGGNGAGKTTILESLNVLLQRSFLPMYRLKPNQVKNMLSKGKTYVQMLVGFDWSNKDVENMMNVVRDLHEDEYKIYNRIPNTYKKYIELFNDEDFEESLSTNINPFYIYVYRKYNKAISGFGVPIDNSKKYNSKKTIPLSWARMFSVQRYMAGYDVVLGNIAGYHYINQEREVSTTFYSKTKSLYQVGGEAAYRMLLGGDPSSIRPSKRGMPHRLNPLYALLEILYTSKDEHHEIYDFFKLVTGNVLELQARKGTFRQLRITNKAGISYLIDEAASGERALLQMMGRLFYPPVGPNQVVLLDEPEIHLHPSWQSRFMTALKKFFPDTQFIIATHSQAIASSVPPEACYNLSELE